MKWPEEMALVHHWPIYSSANKSVLAVGSCEWKSMPSASFDLRTDIELQLICMLRCHLLPLAIALYILIREQPKAICQTNRKKCITGRKAKRCLPIANPHLTHSDRNVAILGCHERASARQPTLLTYLVLKQMSGMEFVTHVNVVSTLTGPVNGGDIGRKGIS